MNETEAQDQQAVAEPTEVGAAEPPAASQDTEEPRHKAESVRNVIAEWTVTILLLLFGTTTLVQTFVIPTPSMDPTLKVGDYLLVDKLTYSPPGRISRLFLPYEEPKDGDIIVFRYPLDITQNYVKRVIGIPGDRIKLVALLDLNHSKVTVNLFRNGQLVNEPYAHYSASVDYYRDNFPNVLDVRELGPSAHEMLRDHVDVKTGELVVPPGAYFAMGDNRDNSQDSRYWGFVPRANIIGKPLLVYWSYPDAVLPGESTAGGFLRHAGDIIAHFFSRTRWNRMFRPWLLH